MDRHLHNVLYVFHISNKMNLLETKKSHLRRREDMQTNKH